MQARACYCYRFPLWNYFSLNVFSKIVIVFKASRHKFLQNNGSLKKGGKKNKTIQAAKNSEQKLKIRKKQVAWYVAMSFVPPLAPICVDGQSREKGSFLLPFKDYRCNIFFLTVNIFGETVSLFWVFFLLRYNTTLVVHWTVETLYLAPLRSNCEA